MLSAQILWRLPYIGLHALLDTLRGLLCLLVLDYLIPVEYYPGGQSRSSRLARRLQYLQALSNLRMTKCMSGQGTLLCLRWSAFPGCHLCLNLQHLMLTCVRSSVRYIKVTYILRRSCTVHRMRQSVPPTGPKAQLFALSGN